MTATDYIAIYGAIVATLVLIWDAVKWFSTGPKLKVSARCHVVYPDSRVLRVESTESGEVRNLAEYCHIEVINTGDRPATVISIEGTHKHKKNEPLICSTGPQFEALNGKQLPLVLGPGEMWSARFEMSNLYILAERGTPVIRINASYVKHPITVRPRI